MISRRRFLCAASTLVVAGCSQNQTNRFLTSYAAPSSPPALPAHYGPMPDEQFPIPAIPEGVVPEKYWRARVPNPFGWEPPGTIVVDPNAFYLHLVEADGTAMRYGIGVGKQGFEWAGDAVVQYKRKWPRWRAPDEMVARDPSLEPYSVANGGMDPGLMNPLGARALYLFQNGEDTLYRIHGNPEPESIGQAVSSGCIRMMNQDVVDLYERVQGRSKVVVRPSVIPEALVG